MKTKYQFEIDPFLPLILETIQKTKKETEKNFLIDFLNNQINYINTTVKHFLNDNSEKNTQHNIQYLNNLFTQYKIENGIFGASPKIYDYMRYVLYDRKKNNVKNLDNHKNNDLATYINTKEELALNYSKPNYMSYCPTHDNKKFRDNEPIWIMPYLKHNFVWKNEKENKGEKEEEK